MPVDNDIYNDPAVKWWDEKEYLYVLRTCVNPVRFGYFRNMLIDKLKLNLINKRVLDIGCGGGFLAEEFTKVGCKVTGIDPSHHSIDIAKAHATQMRLTIDYRVAQGEHIPFEKASFDIVCCCDVLEHLDDFEKVIVESSRVLKEGGVFFYDTINRTFLSRLVFIKIAQDWKWTNIVPRGLHDWHMFIKPKELYMSMLRGGIENQETCGLSPGLSLLQHLSTARRIKRGEMTYAEFGRQNRLTVSGDTSVHYLGYGIKR